MKKKILSIALLILLLAVTVSGCRESVLSETAASAESQTENIILRDMVVADIEDEIRWNTVETEWGLWDAPWEDFFSDFDPDVFRKETLKKLQAPKDGFRWRLQVAYADGTHMNLVFTNEFGGYLNPNTVYNHFKEVVAQIGAPDIRFHDMRHSYAVAALQAGDDVKTVQGNLGHATAAFTLDVYGHVTDQMKEESANRMERFIHIVKGA